MELTNIIRKPVEVVHSLRKRASFDVSSTTIENFHAQVNKRVSAFQEQGFNLFLLEFGATENDDGEATATCSVLASRLETEEEMNARIKRQEKYNEGQIKEHAAKVEASKRHKEIERLTSHLTLEQLQAMKGL